MSTQLNLNVTELPLKVLNKPTENVAIMVGILYVAVIEKHSETEWHIRTMFDLKHNLPTEQVNVHTSKQSAINDVYKMLKLV